MHKRSVICQVQIIFIYLGFDVTFNTVQVISQRVVLWAEKNQYIQLVKVQNYKLPTIGKHLSTFPHKVTGLNHGPQRWKVCYHCTIVTPSKTNKIGCKYLTQNGKQRLFLRQAESERFLHLLNILDWHLKLP